MAISLYDASVASFLQILGGASGFLDKGLTHCRETGIDPATIVETSFFPDMRPFRFQVTSLVHHSRGAVDALKTGVFRPPSDRTPYDYVALQSLVVDTRAALGALTADEVDGRDGADVVFEIGDTRRLFTAAGFLISFALPNFHFHAATAYDILRSKGVPLGKRDYMGALRLKA